MSPELASAAGIAAAALGGAAVGVEREWSGHASGLGARFAGVRTFTLLGGVGGLAGWLWSGHYELLAAVVLASAGALVVAAYIARDLWGVRGLLVSGAVLGLTNVDALTLAMAHSAAHDVVSAAAAQAVAIGMLSNTLLKLGLALAIGRARFRRLAAGSLAAMAAAAAVSIALLR